MGFGVRALWGILLHFKAAVALSFWKTPCAARHWGRLATLFFWSGAGETAAGEKGGWQGRTEQSRAGRHRHLQVHDGWSFILSAVTGPGSLLVHTGLAEPQCGGELVEGQCHPVLPACSAPARPPPSPTPDFGAFLKWSFRGCLLSCQRLLGILELGRSFQVPSPNPLCARPIATRALSHWAGPLPLASSQATSPAHRLVWLALRW